MDTKATATVMMTGARPRAMAESGAMPKLVSHVASGSDRLVEATAHERDGDLDGGEQLVGIGGQLNGALGALVALLGLVLQHGALSRGERHLGHGEVAVDEGQNEGGDKGDGYVHREFLEPPRFGTLG